ncbi:hypothetical protein [Aestuariivivens sediminis]|uniref:hypothetical protein n=1 Tax=Aestuariivivens sediminis TaxID=2913557 RepID=UPI001F56F3A0|nr:hypothetical protein [Aestuariivivens sediminis]
MSKGFAFFIFMSLATSILSGQPAKQEGYIMSNIRMDNTVLPNLVEPTYQIGILSSVVHGISCQLKVRVEDELTSEETYVLFQEVSFVDMELTYTISDFQIGFFIENLLDFGDARFAIEPNLERHAGVADMVYFTHEAQFLAGINMIYNF